MPPEVLENRLEPRHGSTKAREKPFVRILRLPLKPILILLGFALTESVRAQTIPGYTLCWADEFNQTDGSTPDAQKWGYDTGASGWGNGELQNYTTRVENARIEAGQLVIEARKENYAGSNYTSARLLTKNKASWTYGRMEARMKLPRGQGIWPAFWMLGSDIDVVGWPSCGEIDIMENIGALPSTVYGTVHGPGYSGSGGIGGSFSRADGALADDFHVFAIEWESNEIRWIIDNQTYFTVRPSDLPSGGRWVFNKPHHLLLNLAVGGAWPGYPNASTTFPQRMMVDYVRVYQRSGFVPVIPQFVTVTPAENWIGYMHVSNRPQDGGAYQFGTTWSTADLSASFSGANLILKPNSISDPAAYWYVGGGGPGRPGNKIMDANMYVEKTNNLSGKTVVFKGNVLSNTLTGAHQSFAFIKDFAPDYSSSVSVQVPLTNGVFKLILDTLPGTGRHVQYGFETFGVNVWASDSAAFGSVQIGAAEDDLYERWIRGFEMSSIPAPDLSASGDPDRDGQSNLLEYAINEDPARASISGKMRSQIRMINGARCFELTLPVRDGAVFSGSPAKSAVAGQLAYTVEGSSELKVFDREVTELSPLTEGLPALDEGWSYRSFKLNAAMGTATPQPLAGFLRAKITAVP